VTPPIGDLKVITLPRLWIEILLAPDRHGLTVTEECWRYGISRKTYYAYRARYHEQGLDGLEPRPRRSRSSPGHTPPQVEAMVVSLRLTRPRWGARKIRADLIRRGLQQVPAVSTVHAILRCEGLVGEQGRRRQQHPAPPPIPRPGYARRGLHRPAQSRPAASRRRCLRARSCGSATTAPSLPQTQDPDG
jgi:transposase